MFVSINAFFTPATKEKELLAMSVVKLDLDHVTINIVQTKSYVIHSETVPDQII
jgi:hypothetical protein